MELYEKLQHRLPSASICLVLTLAALASPAFAGGVKWEQLNLSPQQSNKIDHIENEWNQQRDQVSEQIARDKAELKSILPNGDRDRIQFLQMRITHNTMYLQKESMQTFLDKRDILQPEQRAKLQRILPAAVPASAPSAGAARPGRQ